MKNSLYILLLSSFLFSCTEENRVIDTNIVLDEQVWNQDNVLDFDLEIVNDSCEYEFSLNLRNGLDYPFRNIFAEQAELQLFDKLGRPFGSAETFLGISYGDLYYSSNSFTKYRFPKPGNYKIKVVQNLRNQPILDGVMAVGIKVSF